MLRNRATEPKFFLENSVSLSVLHFFWESHRLDTNEPVHASRFTFLGHVALSFNLNQLRLPDGPIGFLESLPEAIKPFTPIVLPFV